MILIPYSIRSVAYTQGKGLYLDAPVKQGAMIVAPDKIDRIYTKEEKEMFGIGSPEDEASIRWFENYYTISLDWPDECYINHSFEPTGLWHLGFVFAKKDLSPGTELTMDYRLIIGDNETLPFKDAHTGEPITGFPWEVSLRTSTEQLGRLLHAF